MHLRSSAKCALVAAVLATTLAGCSSIPSGPKFESAADAPPDNARVYFYRTHSHQGKAVAHAVKLNGTKIAELGNRGYFSAALPPGSYTAVSNTTYIDKKLKVELEPGQVYFLRLETKEKPPLCYCTSIEFQKAEPAAAKEELTSMRKETKRVNREAIEQAF